MLQRSRAAYEGGWVTKQLLGPFVRSSLQAVAFLGCSTVPPSRSERQIDSGYAARA